MAYQPSAGLFNPNKSYSSMTPGGFNNLGSTPGMINQPAPNASSAVTKQPVYIPPSIPSPTNSSTAPIKKTVTTTSQGDKHEVHYDNIGGSKTGDTTKTTATPAVQQDPLMEKVVSAPTSNPVQPPAPPTFPGMIGGLANTSTSGSATAPGYIQNTADYGAQNAATGQQAIDIAKQFGQKYADVGSQSAKFQAGQLTTGTTPVAEGNAAVTARTQAAQQTALAQGEQAALQGIGYQQSGLINAANASNAAAGQAQTGQGLVQTGLLGAAGLVKPEQVGYNVQYTDPMTGQPYSGGSSQTLKDAVSGVVEKLKAGTMGYNDALTALQGYGQGGINALQSSLPPGFNIAQSNTLAGQQGSIGVNYQLADTALTNVENIQKQLGTLQKTNQPIINSVANWISTQFGVGSKETRAMTGAVASLRNAYASLLASSKGGTPTDYSGQAQAEIPNEPTPNDIAAIRQNFETLGKARADILGNPGQSNTNQNANTNSSNIYSW